nr:hypothetical protein [uncultured Actinoplanes sp.]
MTYPGGDDLEAPDEDAAEQARNAYSEDYDQEGPGDPAELRDTEAPEWDVAEQHQSVDGEYEDEYR